jgi:nitrogenase molybdenum-iron protein alpha/beta subunit
LSPHDLSFNPEHYFDNYINNVESVFWTEESLIKSIKKILSKNDLKVVYIITTDVPEITGFDINQVTNTLSLFFKEVKFIYLKWQAIWWNIFEWYKEALSNTLYSYNFLNKSINTDDKLLNIFWYFFTRNEWDFEWDYTEFKNILEDLWIKINTFYSWTSNYSDLEKISKSSDSILFSYADTSKQILEEKYNQSVKMLDFPIWIQFTINFIKKIWNIFNIKTKKYLDMQLSRIIPKIDLVHQVLLWKNFWIVWDSQRLNWLLDLLLDIWLKPKFVIYVDEFIDSKEFISSLKNKYNYFEDIDLFVDVDRNTINKIINDDIYNLDLIIWSSIEKSNIKNNIPFLEFFFPCITRHFINKYTYVWFNWVLNILNDIYNLINKPEYYILSNSLGNLMGDFSFYYSKNDK